MRKGVTPNRACIEMGFSRSMAAKWKKTNTMPSASVLPKIADYFGVSIDYLLSDDIASENHELNISDEDLKFALFGERDIDDELLEEVKRFAQFANEKKRLDKNR